MLSWKSECAVGTLHRFGVDVMGLRCCEGRLVGTRRHFDAGAFNFSDAVDSRREGFPLDCRGRVGRPESRLPLIGHQGHAIGMRSQLLLQPRTSSYYSHIRDHAQQRHLAGLFWASATTKTLPDPSPTASSAGSCPKRDRRHTHTSQLDLALLSPLQQARSGLVHDTPKESPMSASATGRTSTPQERSSSSIKSLKGRKKHPPAWGPDADETLSKLHTLPPNSAGAAE